MRTKQSFLTPSASRQKAKGTFSRRCISALVNKTSSFADFLKSTVSSFVLLFCVDSAVYRKSATNGLKTLYVRGAFSISAPGVLLVKRPISTTSEIKPVSVDSTECKGPRFLWSIGFNCLHNLWEEELPAQRQVKRLKITSSTGATSKCQWYHPPAGFLGNSLRNVVYSMGLWPRTRMQEHQLQATSLGTSITTWVGMSYWVNWNRSS